MSVHLVEPGGKRDWATVTDATVQGILEAVSGNVPNTNAAIRKVFGAESAAEHSTDNRAWNWCFVTLATAVPAALADPCIAPFLDEANAGKGSKGFIENTSDFGGDAALDSSALRNPANLPAFAKARLDFPALLNRIAPGADLTDEQARNLFDSKVRETWSRVFTMDVGYYRQVVEALGGLNAEADRRELAWLRHEDWVRGLYNREQIFEGEQEDGRVLTLAHTYLKLRCYWHVPVENWAEEAREQGRREVEVHVGWLHDTVHRWLEDPKGGPVRVVAGGPGSGKSSFARAIATEVIDGATHRVVFIPLQHMRLDGDLGGQIGKFLHGRHSAVLEDGGKGFPENPLDWVADDATPLLFIFDGLDELARSDDKAEDLTRKFIVSVQNMIASRQGAKAMRALVLGRSTACQQAMKEATLDSDCLLHVAPLPAIDVEGDVYGAKHQLSDGSHETVAVHDPAGALKSDQRKQFWEKWCGATGQPCGDIPEAVTHSDMGELNAEPLLLYLLILSGYTGDNWREAKDNRSHVYHAIFARIFKRNKDKEHFANAHIDEDDFFTLMECLGLAAWQGNGRTGSDADFEKLRGLYDPSRKKKFRELTSAKLANVAIQFYTRQDVGDTQGFEFIHKSFGEYLAARALLNGSRRIAWRLQNEDAGEKAGDVVGDWMRLVGDAGLTFEILRFLREEARRVASESMKADLVSLTDLFSWVLRNGIPVHRAFDDEESYRVLEARQRKAEGALLASLTSRAAGVSDNNIVRVTPTWPNTYAVADFLARQQTEGDTIIRVGFLHLDVSGADLSGADLRGADLSGAYLIEADLFGADLRGANLSEANLSGANLIEADLFGANLSGANLSEANLSGAGLSGVDLSGADLSGADLIEADLSGAYLSGADLSWAYLIEADLRGADLRGTDCNRTRIVSCLLQSAILRDTKNLTQMQIDGAYLDEHTKLPGHLVYRPKDADA